VYIYIHIYIYMDLLVLWPTQPLEVGEVVEVVSALEPFQRRVDPHLRRGGYVGKVILELEGALCA